MYLKGNPFFDCFSSFSFLFFYFSDSVFSKFLTIDLFTNHKVTDFFSKNIKTAYFFLNYTRVKECFTVNRQKTDPTIQKSDCLNYPTIV